MSDLDGSLFGTDQACFGCGPVHPHGFRLSFSEEGEELVTRFTPHDGYQGPPGVMHGGLVFTLADELAAWAVIVRLGKFGFTAKVASRFLRPVRIGVEVEGRARIVKKATRTAEVIARLKQNGEDVFSSTMTFALLDKAGAEKLLGSKLPEAWERYTR